MTDDSRLPAVLDTTVPHSARTWNYWMGGKDNYAADRAAGDAFARLYPGIWAPATHSRRFLIRVVHHLAADVGVRQFLDIGTGLPTMDNTHQVAQRAAPESRIVYVDNDPLVLAHARALLVNTTPEGVTAYVDADLHDPDLIVSDAKNVLNLTQPVAVMFMGVLGHVADYEEARSIVSRVMAAVPSGSYLVLWDGTDSEALSAANEDYRSTGGVPYLPRSEEEIGGFFEGLEVIGPGLVSIAEWQPGGVDTDNAEPVDGVGAVARKP
ncbi:SAM-dependent methyltransferase [Actinomycetes bacterium KLBMP 9759]